MSALSIIDVRGIIRNMLIELYKDDPIATQFLASFFRMKESRSKSVSIEVERADENVAVDVQRGTEGNRNSFDVYSIKQFVPPYYREYFDATELDFYDRLFGSAGGDVNAADIAEWAEEISSRLRALQKKIMRRKELASSQVLETGIVTLKNGDNVDYKRKAASIEDLTAGGGYWDTAIDPFVSLERGCDFIRQQGKAQSQSFNLLLGSEAMNALFNNDAFVKKANLRRVDQVSINPPQLISDGKAHGDITVGSYNVRVWGYPEFYKDPVTPFEIKPYIPTKKAIIIPENPVFTMAHAAVPISHRTERGADHIQFQPGEFAFGDYVDPKLEKHIFDVKSSFIPIPVGVDQIWTALAVTP